MNLQVGLMQQALDANDTALKAVVEANDLALKAKLEAHDASIKEQFVIQQRRADGHATALRAEYNSAGASPADVPG